MGCAISKHDELPAVALCRERFASLEEAIRFRYSLADAHLAYMVSLEGVGASLCRLFEQSQRKGETETKVSGSLASKVIHHHVRSISGSHLHLDFDSDSDDLSSEALHHHLSGKSSPFHSYRQIDHADQDQEFLNSHPREYLNSNFSVSYAKNNVVTSVVYEQKQMVPETVYIGEFPSSSSYYSSNPYYKQNQDQNNYTDYSNPGYHNFFGGPSYNYSSTPTVKPPVDLVQSEESNTRPPPPPPPQPQSSAWDFFNPFENDDGYYQQYTSGEVREVEGIPDLENEEGIQPKIVKEVLQDDKNSVHDGFQKDSEDNRISSDSLYPSRKSNSTENTPVELEVPMVDKKVDMENISGDHGNTPAFNVQSSTDSEIVKEIQTLFQRTSESGHLLTGILEVGKMPYKKGVGYHHENGDPNVDEIVGSGNLSSTLHQLYLWEKKLYNEVKVEEKMRVLQDNKLAKLERMIKRGAEAHKIEATRTHIKSLSTKISIAIQIVDKISVNINILRDNELWPKLNELIKGLAKFWKSSLESLQNQYQVIGQARKFDKIGFTKQEPNNLELTLQIEYDLLNWISKFSSWIVAQKGFVRSLNDWLMKCVLYEPEETPDGIAPFSPGRIGAPRIFIICFQWAQAMERISEQEVIDSIRECAKSVSDMISTGNKTGIDYKNLDKEQRKIQKEIQALDKDKIRLVNDQMVYQGDGGLQISLKRTFETIERFTTESLNAYEELLPKVL